VKSIWGAATLALCVFWLASAMRIERRQPIQIYHMLSSSTGTSTTFAARDLPCASVNGIWATNAKEPPGRRRYAARNWFVVPIPSVKNACDARAGGREGRPYTRQTAGEASLAPTKT